MLHPTVEGLHAQRGEHTYGRPGGPTLRLHVGLENVDDLKADRDRGFAALKSNT